MNVCQIGASIRLRNSGNTCISSTSVPAKRPRMRLGELVDIGLRQSECFADVADRHRVAVLDHIRDKRRMFCAVGREDVFEHLFPRLAREVDVDVRHVLLLAGFVEEAPGKELVLDWVDAGKPEQVTHQRPNRRPASARR